MLLAFGFICMAAIIYFQYKDAIVSHGIIVGSLIGSLFVIIWVALGYTACYWVFDGLYQIFKGETMGEFPGFWWFL